MKKSPVGATPGIFLLLAAAGLALLNYPFLGIFRDSDPTGGFPPLVAFLFLVWGLLIIAIFLVTGQLGPDSKEKDEAQIRRKTRRP